MSYGWVTRGILLLTLFAAAVPAIAQQHRPRAAINAETTITLTGIDTQSLQYTRGDGSAGTAVITPASLFLRQGLLTASEEFSPGETALLRLRTVLSGPHVALLSDVASAEAIAHWRRHPVTGNIQSVGNQALVVLPDSSPDGVPITLRLSHKTVYRANGASADISAFGQGMEVVVVTRGLANGLLEAVSVSEAGMLSMQAAPKSLSGSVEDFQPAANILTVLDKGGTRHFVAVGETTRIKLKKQAATPIDLQPGMRVIVRFSTDQDAGGNPLAASISASSQ